MCKLFRNKQNGKGTAELERIRLEVKTEELQKKITKIKYTTGAFWLRDQKQVMIRELEKKLTAFD
jgi:hypothetical protein